MTSRKQKFDIEKELADFLRSRCESRNRLLVAVSGGPDSMALLAACNSLSTALGLKIFAAHFIHHPESAEARARARLVAVYCRKLKIRLFRAELGKRDKDKHSPEERMRLARYQFLDEAAQKFSCDWILTAHHADDQAETVLMRVLVGTGPRGLIGIQAQRGLYLRPFLGLPRSALLQYCQAHGMPFADDPANLDLSIPRNRLRHEILPLLRCKVNPDVESALVRLGRWAEEADEVISAQVQSCWAASCRKNAIPNRLLPKAQIVLDIDAILPYYNMIRKYTLLKAICAAAGTEVALKATDLDRSELLLHARRTGTLLELSSGIRLIKHGREIIVAKAGELARQHKLTPGRNRQLIKLGYRARWKRIQSGPYENGCGLAADLTIQDGASPLILRTAQEGDRFYPLGAPGEKRLFRFLTDRKVSRLDKRQTWVLEKDGRIIWVIGHRISEYARVHRRSDQAWRLAFVPIDSERKGC